MLTTIASLVLDAGIGMAAYRLARSNETTNRLLSESIDRIEKTQSEMAGILRQLVTRVAVLENK